jgi:isopentenyl phosphate kinase
VALDHGLTPVVHGDVCLDEVRGGTIISTEQIFTYLAPRLGPSRIVLVGEVDGVLTADPASGVHGELVELISAETLPQVLHALGGSRGVDVTGGMAAKVLEMLTLVRATPGLSAVHIISGLTPGLLTEVLVRSDVRAGTRIVP